MEMDDENGDILEWDKQHGEVEKYDRTGQTHKGAFDPKTGLQLKPAIKKRHTNKFTPIGMDPLPVLKIQVGIYIGIQNAMNRIKDW